MDPLDQLFQQFLRERVCLHNITPKTREFYETAWKAFMRSRAGLPRRDPSAPVITRADLQEFVIHLRERGVKPVSCNCWMRGLNAFCRWLHQEGEISTPLRLPPQKLEKRIVPTHGEAALRTILRFRPKTFVQWRVYAVACTLVDTGCRIEELLTATVSDFDFDNLLLTVVGKGRKQDLQGVWVRRPQTPQLRSLCAAGSGSPENYQRSDLHCERHRRTQDTRKLRARRGPHYLPARTPPRPTGCSRCTHGHCVHHRVLGSEEDAGGVSGGCKSRACSRCSGCSGPQSSRVIRTFSLGFRKNLARRRRLPLRGVGSPNGLLSSVLREGAEP